MVISLTLDGGRFYIETSPLICCAKQWTGFFMLGISVMKKLMTNAPIIEKQTFTQQTYRLLMGSRL